MNLLNSEEMLHFDVTNGLESTPCLPNEQLITPHEHSAITFPFGFARFLNHDILTSRILQRIDLASRSMYE